MKRTFLVRLASETQRLKGEMEVAVEAALKGDDPLKKCLTFEELRRIPKDEESAANRWWFEVTGVIFETERTEAELYARLLRFREQSDPRSSRVSIIELPEDAAQLFWLHAGQSAVEAIKRLLGPFGWSRVPMR